MVDSTLAVHRPSMSLIFRPASATAARAARASTSISEKPVASPQPKVATPAMAALPRRAWRPVAVCTAADAAGPRGTGWAVAAGLSVGSNTTMAWPWSVSTRARTRWPTCTASAGLSSTRPIRRTPSSRSIRHTL